MKKILAILLCLCVTFAFAGCDTTAPQNSGGGSGNGGSGGNPSTAAVQYEVAETYYTTREDSLGNFYMSAFTVVKNTGYVNLYLSSGRFDIENSVGTLIKSQTNVSAFPKVIAPNEQSVYFSEFQINSGNVLEDYKVIPHIDIEKATVSRKRLETSETNISKDQYGFYSVTGRVKNTGAQTETLCYVVAFIYDSAGKIINVSFTFLDELDAGEKIGFEISLIDLGNATPSNIKVISYPRQYQF